MSTVSVVISSLCVLALTGLFLWLSVQVVMLRQKHKVLMGDGGHADLALAQRLHANFVEYTPFALVLYFMASVYSPTWIQIILFLILIAFTISRFLHAFVFGGGTGVGQGRLFGTLISWGSIGLLGFFVFIGALTRM